MKIHLLLYWEINENINFKTLYEKYKGLDHPVISVIKSSKGFRPRKIAVTFLNTIIVFNCFVMYMHLYSCSFSVVYKAYYAYC